MAADHRLIDRLALAELDTRLARFPAVALQLAASRPSVVLDLETPADLARLSDPALYLASQADKLVVLDEVQHLPELFGSLRA